MRSPFLLLLLTTAASAGRVPSKPALLAGIAINPLAVAAGEHDYPHLPIVTLADILNTTSDTDAGRRTAAAACDTTKASPRLHDIDKVVIALKAPTLRWCLNTNDVGSRCTKIVAYHGLAAVSLCGKNFKISCREAGELAARVKERCQWTLYAGGRWVWAKNQMLALHKK
ncbi:hypothetical protein EDC01DRAFT_785357 [Geopyxis carbonaria]|nr:hypothetical protein EDC01DRAFT_785357 [Geopyxis carbonaria]